MIKSNRHVKYFRDGRKAVLLEVCERRDQGLWTELERADELREALYYQQCSRHAFPEASAYHAGRVAGLRSHLCRVERHALPRVRCSACEQEALREEHVYSTADGWDWDGDEDNFGVTRSSLPEYADDELPLLLELAALTLICLFVLPFWLLVELVYTSLILWLAFRAISWKGKPKA